MADFHNRTLVDPSGARIGRITDVLHNHYSLKLEWLVVKLGWLAGERLVPVEAVDDRGDQLVAKVAKDHVKTTPRVKRHTVPTATERGAIYRHLGVPVRGDRQTRDSTAGSDTRT